MFKDYLKNRKGEILIIVSIFSLMYLIMFLSNNIYENYFYTVFLVAFFYIVYFIYGYFKYKKHLEIVKNININNIDDIYPSNLIEDEYLKKISYCMIENKKNTVLRNNDLDQLKEDYTIWIHQAKTPIAALSLIIDSVELEEKSDMKQELFKINQYTDMALTNIRLQDIHKDLEIREHDLYELVKSTIKKYALYFNYKGNVLKLEEFSKKIVTDEKWFIYGLDQIISNAVKYTKNGEVSISLKENYLIIEDTGIGIREEDIPKLFTRGFTGYTGRIEKKATGLGLYMSKKILTTLGSSIKLESIAGKGTKVYIKIPEDE